MIKRIFDFCCALIVLIILVVPMLVIAILIKLTSRGPVLYWSDRVGQYNRVFKMPKFRTMRIDTPVVPTHLLTNPKSYLTPMGSFLRRTSLDELPQLWCVFSGKMSIVGPRPVLFNQGDIIKLRTEVGVEKLVPGITGWAQINGRDKLSTSEKVEFDAEYLNKKSFLFDCKIIFLTIIKVLLGSGISH